MTPAQLLAALAPLAGTVDYVHVNINPDVVDVQFGTRDAVDQVDAACALLDITPEWAARQSSLFPWQYSATTRYGGRQLTVRVLCTDAEHDATTSQVTA